MGKNKFKLTTIAAFLLLLGSAFFFMRPTEVNAGLAHTKYLGNVIGSSVPTNFVTYWNQVTAENSCKWSAIEASRDAMNWSVADIAYNYARSNGFPFKFYTLIWGADGMGSWFSNISQADQRLEVTEWIQAAGVHFKDAAFVDVVNEPLNYKPSWRYSIGGDGSTGWDWVIWSFEQARIAFPNSKLLINEYNIMNDPNAAAEYITIINLLKDRGLIDGIGIQCHLYEMQSASTSTIKSILDMLAETGLPIYISELDLGGDDGAQLARYQSIFPVLWEHPAVAGVTLWGYNQGQTWKDDTWLISTSGVERPALQWLRSYFLIKGTPTPTSRITPTLRLTPTPSATTTSIPAPTATPTRRTTPTPTRRRFIPTVTRRIAVTPTPTLPRTSVPVTCVIQSDWGNGCSYAFTLTNNTSWPIYSWKISFTFTGDQRINSILNASFTQIGSSATLSGNRVPANGGSINFGINVTGTGRGISHMVVIVTSPV